MRIIFVSPQISDSREWRVAGPCPPIFEGIVVVPANESQLYICWSQRFDGQNWFLPEKGEKLMKFEVCGISQEQITFVLVKTPEKRAKLVEICEN
jgi:hypothetical protein